MSSAPKKRKIEMVSLLKEFIIINHGEAVLQDLLESAVPKRNQTEECSKVMKEKEALNERIRVLESKEPPSTEELLSMTSYEKLIADLTSAENRKKNYWRIPPEIWCKILRYLPPKQRVRIARVDRVFREVVRLNGMLLFNMSQEIVINSGNVIVAGEKYKLSRARAKKTELKVFSFREHLFARAISTLKVINAAKCEKTETFLLELPDLLQRYPQKFDIQDVKLILPRDPAKAVATLQSVLTVAARTVKHLSIENFNGYLQDNHDGKVQELNCLFKKMSNLESLDIDQFFLGDTRDNFALVKCLEGLNLKSLGIGSIQKRFGWLLGSVLQNVSSRRALLENLTIYGVSLHLEEIENIGQCRQSFQNSRSLLKNVRNLGYFENRCQLQSQRVTPEKIYSSSPFAISVTELFEMFPKLQILKKTYSRGPNPEYDMLDHPDTLWDRSEKILSFLDEVFIELKKRGSTEMFTLKMSHGGAVCFYSELFENINSVRQHRGIRVLDCDTVFRDFQGRPKRVKVIKMQSGDQHITLELCLHTGSLFT